MFNSWNNLFLKKAFPLAERLFLILNNTFSCSILRETFNIEILVLPGKSDRQMYVQRIHFIRKPLAATTDYKSERQNYSKNLLFLDNLEKIARL